jgi:hypothetical protein
MSKFQYTKESVVALDSAGIYIRKTVGYFGQTYFVGSIPVANFSLSLTNSDIIGKCLIKGLFKGDASFVFSLKKEDEAHQHCLKIVDAFLDMLQRKREIQPITPNNHE